MKLDYWLNKKKSNKTSEKSKKEEVVIPIVPSIRNNLPLTQLHKGKIRNPILRKLKKTKTDSQIKKNVDFEYFVDYYSENL